MSAVFDKYEEDFVALAAKAGISLAMVGTSSTDSDEMSDTEHVQVASMLLAGCSDLLDAMEVELRVFAKKNTPSFQRRRVRSVLGGGANGGVSKEVVDLRKRLDGCADMCSALRMECRNVRTRLKEDDEKRERMEEVSFEEGDTAEDDQDAGTGGGEGSGTKKVKQWTCDVCKVAKFIDYDEACKHEESCDGKAPPPAEDELSFSGKGSGNNNRSANHAKGRSSAANAYRSSLFDKAEEATLTLASQNATLENARRVMADTEATAGMITEELARNRESIESARGHVGELHGMTNSARRTIKTMQRRKKYLF